VCVCVLGSRVDMPRRTHRVSKQRRYGVDKTRRSEQGA
jgi:hypothetical protein